VVSHIPIISTSVFFDGDNEKSGNWNVPRAWMHIDARKIKDLFADYPNFDFTRFYESLHRRGQVIYQGKLSDTNCFRIGNSGQLYLEDIDKLLSAIKDVLEEIGIIVPNLTVQ